MDDKPYDYTQLDEIILFDGSGDIIELTREGRYINLIKPTEINKRYYRYDLKEKKFQRINFYKTTDDKITDVKVKNITKWFKDARIKTKDIHFGRLIIYAKFNNSFNMYKSPVRFIEKLGHKMITSIEQWEALGLKVKEMEDFFGPHLVSRHDDIREDIYKGKEFLKRYKWGHRSRPTFYGPFDLAPGDFSKELLEYIKNNYEQVDHYMLKELYNDYNNGEFYIEKKLKEIGQDPEFIGIFHYYPTMTYSRRNVKQKWAFGTSGESKRVKRNLIHTIREFNLDLIALARWLKKQQHVDKNDVGYLFGTGNHYCDYLECERDLCDGKLSKMDKYPDNFRSQFHRIQEEFAAKKGNIDEAKFERQANKNQDLEHIGRKYQIIIPRETQEINHEAQCLGHCVRTYIPKVIRGETLILFLRDKEKLDEPLVTLEVKRGVLTQAYGKNDCKPKKEYLDFLKMWCRMKKLRVGCWKNDLS